MDSASMDHYEKQLYTVFKTFDVGNEEALDRSAVLDLCDALQLEDRGAALADTLFERPQGRVTFTQFRNGLLSVLGGGPPQATTTPALPPPLASDDDSSGREVAPKLVVGAKKYGRRSRPPSASPQPHSPDAPSEPDDDRLRRRMKCKRSAPSTEAETPESSGDATALEHDRRVDCAQAFDLCRALNMDVNRSLVRQVFDDAAVGDLSVGEFFDRLNASLSESVAGASSSSDETALPSAAVADAWERAGVQHARRLLRELGFTAPLLRAADLARALDDEMHALPPPALLYSAALALHRLRVSHAEQRADASRAEASKLRGDLVAADRRAQALAQEVDENHMRLESSVQGRLRQLETRHADELRARTSELQAERERALNVAAEQQRESARAAAEESRLRAEVTAANEREHSAQARTTIAEERARKAEAERDRALVEVAELMAATTTQDLAPNILSHPEEEERAALALLRDENKLLRDRVDELVAEMEMVCRGVGATVENDVGGGASWREEVGGESRHFSLVSLNSAPNYTDECDQSLVSIDQKVFGHIEVVRRLQCVLDSVPQVPLSIGCESCDTLKGIITSIQERIQEFSESMMLPEQTALKLDTSSEAGVQTESIDGLEAMKKQLAEAELKHSEEKQRLSSLVKDLETSLDQMKMEYDKCEEYWSNKLDEERDIYAEEQKISDERLTELISKISEYEQQFAPKTNSKSSLPTIDEKYSLEVQFNDLEEEFDKYKTENKNEIEAKNTEIKILKDRIKALEDKPVTNGHGNSSPIEYLWNQGTIHSPYKNETRRDYQNPAYVTIGDVRCSSDSEREKAVSPIRRPARSASLEGEDERERKEAREPQMINCSDLEGQLRQQAQMQSLPPSSGGGDSRSNVRNKCACAALQARCKQLSAALAHRQMCLDAVRQAARSEGSQLRARVSAAESAVMRLQARLTAADVLVKELYLENCHLTHHQPRLL